MLKAGHLLLVLLLFAAGCSSTRRYHAKPTDWSDGHVPPPTVKTNRPPPFIAPTPRPPPPVQFTETWVALDRWSRVNGFGPPKKLSAQSRAVFEVATPTGVLELTATSRLARWGGMVLHLGFAPRVINGALFVHNLDLRKNFQPLLQNFLPPPPDHRVIVLDPGHGGTEVGAHSVVNGRFEKEFTLDWAQRLAPLLVANGWTVFLTRTSDTGVALTNRVALAEARHADLFVSLHFNALAPEQNRGAGLETFCLTPTGMPSTLARGYPDDWSRAFPNNDFDARNLQLAALLHRALLRATGLEDHGVSRARFMTVVRGQNRPAVLIEGGYLSNPAEARRIADPAFRQKLAEAIADALK